MVNDNLRAAVRDAISTEWHRRIAEQIADSPGGHIDAIADAVMDRLAQVHEAASFSAQAHSSGGADG